MDRRTFMKTTGAAALMLTASRKAGWAQAAADEVAKLGTSLTPIGATKEGNADGLIVPWSGKWNSAPPGVDFKGTGNVHPDPYANEKPLFTITPQNYTKYEARLSEGQKAMFQKYPETFKMNVYPCHRDFRFSDWTQEQIKLNAQQTTLQENQDGLKNALGGAAFPFPKSGMEAIWSINTATKMFTERGAYDEAVVYPDGNIAWGTNDWDIWAPPYDPSTDRATWDLRSSFLFRKTLRPERDRGSVGLVISAWDYTNQPTQTWQYLPGTRRVRQVPEIAGDYQLGPGGFHTVDDTRLWSETPRRYEWTLEGKKEIFVPYHTYKLDQPGVTYKDLLLKSHLNPEFMRWELHRVWVVKAKLKPGIRHIYGARTIYADEDSWQPLLADIYDTRGQLYRQEMNTMIYAYDGQLFLTRIACYHDLVSGAYMADRLINEIDQKPRFNEGGRTASFYTVDGLRRRGV
jgi:hypothetical protein